MSKVNVSQIKADRKLLARIFSKIHVSTENFYNGVPCWEWQASLNGGYASISYKHLSYYAHRFIYELLIEPIDRKLQCDHLCRVKHCVNPAHIEPVTPQVNTLRGESCQAKNAKKTHCIHGHEFTPENTYVYYTRDGKFNKRSCRTCLRKGTGHNRDKKFCKYGHEYTPENTYISYRRDGTLRKRTCRICQRYHNRVNQSKYRKAKRLQ